MDFNKTRFIVFGFIIFLSAVIEVTPKLSSENIKYINNKLTCCDYKTIQKYTYSMYTNINTVYVYL